MSHNDTQRDGGTSILRNRGIKAELPGWLFEPDQLRARDQLQGTSNGRRQAWFVRHAGLDLVLRHYWRGGMVAVLNPDVYIRSPLTLSRPFREYRLLERLRERDLPVPEPIAARVQSVAGLAYRGDLLTRAIPAATSFADRIHAGEDAVWLWERIGATVASFHGVGAIHADLNVRNILIDDDGRVWLIDWDRGWFARGARRAAQATLTRLRRSLSREPALEARANAAWPALQRGYCCKIQR